MSNSDSRDLRDQEWFVILSRRKAAECQSRQANMVAAAELEKKYSEEDAMHWARQDAHSLALLKRLEACRDSSASIDAAVEQRLRAGAAHVDALLANEATGVSLQDHGSLRQASIAFEVMRKSAVEEFGVTRARVFERAATITSELSAEAAKRTEAVRDNEKALRAALMQKQLETRHHWLHYHAALSNDSIFQPLASFDNGVAKPIERQAKSVSLDPIVHARRFTRSLDAVRTVEDVYSDRMARAFNEIRLADGRRIDSSKNALLDFLIGEKQLVQSRLKCVESALSFVGAIDSASDIDEWLRRAGLDGARESVAAAANATPPPSSSSSPLFNPLPPLAGHNDFLALMSRPVVHDGVLGRQGALFKSSFSDTYCMVTATGFFHSFTDIGQVEPRVSIHLAPCAIFASADAGTNCLVIEQPTTGFLGFGSSTDKFVFQATSDTNLQLWLSVLRAVQSHAALSLTVPAAAAARAASPPPPPPPLPVKIDSAFAVALEAGDHAAAHRVATRIVAAAPSSEVEALVHFMFALLEQHPLCMLPFIDECVRCEVDATADENTLFRANSLATRMVMAFVRQRGQPWLHACAQTCVAEAVTEFGAASVEIDPARGAGDAGAVQANLERIEFFTCRLVAAIQSSTAAAPQALRELMRLVQNQVVEKFPAQRTACIGGFLFLRYLCPALLAPEKENIYPGRLTPAAQRGLTLIAKILQNLSNSVAFGDKEAYMQPLNPLLTQNFPVMAAFLLDFVDLAKNAQIEHNPLFFSDVHAVAAVATTSSVASLAAEPAQSVSATSSDTAATAANQD